jgi:hypothetical protein
MNLDTPIRLTDLSRRELLEESSLNCVKFLSCLAHTNGNKVAAAELFTKKFAKTHGATEMQKWLDTGEVTLTLKAAVNPATTTDAVWAKPLVGVEQWTGGFLAIAHSQSLLGRIPGLVQVPFNVKIPFQTGEGAVAWVQEAMPVPATAEAYSDGVTLAPTKVGRIAALSEEFAKLANAGTAPAMRRALIAKFNSFIDRQLLDPAVAAVVGKNPASITNGTTPLVGTSDVRASVAALTTAFFAGRPGAEAPVLIANGNYAAQIRGLNPGVGFDVIASEGALSNLILLDPEGVLYAAGELEIAFTRDAMVQMNDVPDAPVTAATTFLSLYQVNCVGYKLVRYLSWAAAPNAVKYSTMP